jgi:hypothetical protein
MRLYVCWDDRAEHPLIGSHPCGIAAEALKGAEANPAGAAAG